MSETIYLKNISGQNFFIPEINQSKAIGSDPNKVWKVNRSILDENTLVRGLVNAGKFIVVDYQEPSEPIAEIESKPKARDVSSIKEENSVDRHLKNLGPSKKIEEKVDDVFSFGDASIQKKENNTKIEIVENKIETIKKTEPNKPNVWWRGPANDMGGYGKMNRYCLQGLYESGVHIELDMHNIPSIRNTIPLTEGMEEMLNNKVSPKAPSVWAIMPPKFPTRQGKIIYFTMLESGAIHPSFLKKLNNADEIWVPSKFNMNVLQQEDLKADLHHIPLGVDTSIYNKKEVTPKDRSKFNIVTKGFTFISVFGWSLRKGNDVLLKSYLKSFDGNDDVTLLIVSRLNGSSSVENIKRIREEISSYIRTYSKSPNNHPHIVHIGVGIPEQDMPLLYNMCNCFVMPSRGEGFGLPYIEAGACGLPVIATRCGGQLDFLNDENAYLVDIEGYGMEKQEIKDISSYYEDVPFAVLGQTAISQLAEMMREVYINRRESSERGEILMRHIQENFTWDKAVQKIHERIVAGQR